MTIVITAEGMRKADKEAARSYGIPGIVLMERAGLACANEALTMINRRSGAVCVLCGPGNNGGDGFVAARHLILAGRQVTVGYFEGSKAASYETAANLRILKKIGVPVRRLTTALSENLIARVLDGSCLVVDALFGIGLSRPVEEPFATLIRKINASGKPVLSVDIPSGLNADTGKATGPCVRASRTVTFEIPKKGFFRAGARAWTGTVKVAEIGIPRPLLARFCQRRKITAAPR